MSSRTPCARILEAHQLLAHVFGHDLLDGDARLVQHGAADRDAGRELHAVDAQRQQAQAVDLLDLVGADEMAGRDQLRQHHGDGLESLDLFLVVLAAGAVLHDQHAQHAAGAHDRHAGERVVDFLTGFRAVGELRMALRVVERQRPGVGGNVAHQAFADPAAGCDARPRD